MDKITEKELCKQIMCPLSWAKQFRQEHLTQDVEWFYDQESSRKIKPVCYTIVGAKMLTNAFSECTSSMTESKVDHDRGLIGIVAAKFTNPRIVKIVVDDGEPELCQVRDSRAMTLGMEIPVKKNSGSSTPWTLELTRINDGKHRFISLEKLIRANRL